MEGKCKVIVRVRPTLEHEPKNDAVTVDTERNSIQVVLPKRKATSSPEKAGKTTQKAKSYTFDCVLGPSQKQDHLFDACEVEELVKSCLQGYSQTVFAFGQTGSGKTYSICGPEPEEGEQSASTKGLLEEAAACCFDKASKSSSSVKIDITCLEIYQEQVTDLLVEKKQVLPVRHHPKYGFYVQGLTQKHCQTVDDYQQVVKKAFQRRRVASHSLNERSTRSHLMITIHLTSKPRVEGSHSSGSGSTNANGGAGDAGSVPSGLSTFGRLCFVDLAGSERLGDTKSKSSSASIRAETGSINKSLFVLGKVISMLGNAKARRSNLIIPFRDSKLTQLLMDSLQGKGKATMIACCSPLENHCDVTLSTLHYASLAQNVKSDPVIIHDPQDQLVIDLRKTILELKAENKKLAVQLTQMTSDMPMPTETGKTEEGNLEVAEDRAPRVKESRANVVEKKVESTTSQSKKKSSDKLQILKERSTLKRNANKMKTSSAPKARSTKTVPRTPKALSQSPYGGDSGKIPPKIPRGSSAKTKGKAQTLPKKKTSKKSKKRVLKDSLQVNIAALDNPTSVDDFPDLAALESKFQAQMAQLNGDDQHDSNSTTNTNQLSGLDHSINAMANTVTTDSNGSGSQEEFEGDAEAVRWAKRNPWFGNDYEMTQYAYEIHDYLVDRNVDPNSKQYYREIESRVRERFPDRMPAATPSRQKTRRASRSNRTVGGRLSQSIKSSIPRVGGDKTTKKTKRSLSLRSNDSEISFEGSYSSEASYKTSSKQSNDRKSIDFSHASERNTSSGLSKDQSERQYIVEELRRIKQEAEEERKWMLNQIKSTLSSYNYN